MDIKTVLAGLIGVLVIDLLWKEDDISPNNASLKKYNDRVKELTELYDSYTSDKEATIKKYKTQANINSKVNKLIKEINEAYDKIKEKLNDNKETEINELTEKANSITNEANS